MNTLVPLVFSALSLSPSDNATEAPFSVVLSEPDTAEMIAPTDTVSLTEAVRMVQFDVLGREGGSRRVMMTLGTDGTALDIRDGGSFGDLGFVDGLYLTDRKRETISAAIEVSDASPRVSPDPENPDRVIIELTDRIVLEVFNFDTAEKESYVVRDNQVMFSVGSDGIFRLTSIRPKPNDLEALVSTLRVYSPDNDEPLDAAGLSAWLSQLFPVVK